MATTQRTLSFDLSWLGAGFDSRDYTASLQGQRAALTLASGPGSTTHQVEVDFDPSKLGLLRVYGPNAANGFPTLAALALVTATDSGAYGVDDTARALVFVNPTITVLTPRHADVVLAHLTATSSLTELSFALQVTGANWCEPVAMTDAQGQARYVYELNSGVRNSLVQPSLDAKQRVYSEAQLTGVRWNLQPGVSCVQMANAASSAPLAAAALAAAPAPDPDSGYKVVVADAGPNYGLSISVDSLSDDLLLSVTVTNSYIRHTSVFASFLKLDGTAMIVPDNIWTTLVEGATRAIVVDWLHAASAEQIDELLGGGSNTLKWLGTVGSESTFLGVPVSDSSISFSFKPPQDQGPIGKIRVLVGSLGISSGNDADPAAAWLGLALTALIDLALPTFSLILGVGEESSDLFDSIFTDKLFLLNVGYQVVNIVADAIMNPGNLGGDLSSLFVSLTDSLVSKVITSAEVIGKLAGIFGAEAAEEAIPLVGWAMQALAIEGTIAQLAQTIGEVIASPRVVEFDLTISMTARITLVPDPGTGDEFAATATQYTITAHYSHSVTRQHTGTIRDSKVAELLIVWDDVPVGGKVSFTVALSSAQGWIVGRGSSANLDNHVNATDPQGVGVFAATISVRQELYPLSAQTRYQHSQLLSYGAQGYAWQQTGTAPTQTRYDLGTGPVGHVLEDLSSLTLSDDLGVLGYSWEAAGLGIPPVDGGPVQQTELYTMQSIGFKPIAGVNAWPEAGYMTAPAGYAKAPLLLYRRTVHAGDAGDSGPGCLFLDPDGDSNTGYHLRGITPVTDPKLAIDDPSRLFDLSKGQSWGRFPWQPTSLAIHSNGVVLAVNPDFDNLLILHLPGAACADSQAPWASYPLGPGTAPGRVSQPTLVAIRPDQTLLVLEAGNNRVQALSRGGHPVPTFADGEYWFSLVAHATAQVLYLAMSVDVANYVYILSQYGDGYQAGDFWLEVYAPTGALLFAQQGLVAARMVVDLWRNVYTLNFQQISGYQGRPEPSLSEYIPATPKPD